MNAPPPTAPSSDPATTAASAQAEPAPRASRPATRFLHHLSLGVTDLPAAVRFYDAALAALGAERVWSDLRPGEPGQAVGYGWPGGGDRLALKAVEPPLTPLPGFHLAFGAATPAAVAAFHAAALTAGGADNGPPGLRPDYGPGYYAAYVIDPDGHHLEAVSRVGAAAQADD